jgi:hypothetical protein
MKITLGNVRRIVREALKPSIDRGRVAAAYKGMLPGHTIASAIAFELETTKPGSVRRRKAIDALIKDADLARRNAARGWSDHTKGLDRVFERAVAQVSFDAKWLSDFNELSDRHANNVGALMMGRSAPDGADVDATENALKAMKAELRDRLASARFTGPLGDDPK